MPDFNYTDLLNPGPDDTTYRLLTKDFVTTAPFGSTEMVTVDPCGLTLLAETAMRDVSHLLRPAHLQQLRDILDDPEASGNDKYVAMELLKNANIAAGMVLPSCQDTGTATVVAKKGQQVFTTGGGDKEALARGVFKTYTESNLRYSQVAPLSMYEEKNTGSNRPPRSISNRWRGTPTNSSFWPKGAGRPTRRCCFNRPRRC